MSKAKDNPRSIRFPPDLEKAIEERAKKENRTFSNMVLTLLQQAIKPGK